MENFLHCPVGTYHDGKPYEVTRERVEAYIDATSDDAARYRRLAVAPPVFGAVASWSSHAGLLWRALSGELLETSVHLGQDMRFFRSIGVGEVISSRAQLAETRASAFGFSLCMRVEVFSEDRELATLAFHRVLFRGLQGGTSEGNAPKPMRPMRTHDSSLGAVTFDIAKDQSLRYGAAAGDFHPIHTDEDFAKRVGFPDLILHGMCTLAMCSRAVIDLAADGDPRRLRMLSATFSKPVVVGRPLLVEVTPAEALFGIAAVQSGQRIIRDGCGAISK